MTKLKSSRLTGGICLLAGILLISICLRSPITGISPLLSLISDTLGLTATQAGMLTTLPLLTFAFFSPVASIISYRVGLEQSLMLSLILITLGLIIRSVGSAVTLYTGTVVIGAGIAIANVLLPSLIKRDYPKQIATITSVYVLMMGVGAALSAGLALPLYDLADKLQITFIPNWAFSLASLIVFPVVAMIIWLPQMGTHSQPTKDTAQIDTHNYLWKHKEAWKITLFLALNSFLMYIFISWLPDILTERGYSHHEAGVIHGIFQIFTALPAVILIPTMAKVTNKQLLSIGLTLPAFIGILGLIYVPSLSIYWVMLYGFGGGGGFIVALTIISSRTDSPQQAATLSGMAQFIAYLFSATGPVTLGAIHEHAGNWHLPLLICGLLGFVWCVFSVLASTNHTIKTPR